MKTPLSVRLTRAWYRDAAWLRYLQPLSLLFGLIARRRRARFMAHPERSFRPDASIVVIGNITAGGTGKTPLTLALAQVLLRHGVHLAIISRGYGGHSKHYPLEVGPDSDPAECGDEALIYAARAGCPVIVDPDRSRAVRFLEQKYRPALILSDDGLQHYALARDVEIAVVDGQRGLGNGRMLPRGPLREPAARLAEVDMLLINGEQRCELPQPHAPAFSFYLRTGRLYNLKTGAELSGEAFLQQHGGRVHAVAGIGNPERFFSTLTSAGFAIITHVFTDHHRFSAAEIDFDDALPVVMTEKDAVKCRAFAGERHWYLCVDAALPEGLLPLLLERLRRSGGRSEEGAEKDAEKDADGGAEKGSEKGSEDRSEKRTERHPGASAE